jgi:hypothetical protein
VNIAKLNFIPSAADITFSFSSTALTLRNNLSPPKGTYQVFYWKSGRGGVIDVSGPYADGGMPAVRLDGGSQAWSCCGVKAQGSPGCMSYLMQTFFWLEISLADPFNVNKITYFSSSQDKITAVMSARNSVEVSHGRGGKSSNMRW